MSVPILALYGLFLLAALMLGLWYVQRATGDAGVVDVGWAAGVGLVALLGAVLGEGDLGRRVLVALLAGIWSARLALYLLSDRVLSGDEDGRYQELRRSWGERFQPRIFWFFQAQALLSVAFALAPLVAMSSRRGGLDLLDAGAALLWMVAVGGESLADRQLARFKARPENRGTTCREGLWRYSRHPNYFFEWLHWWAYALAGWTAPLWWITVAAPLVMLFFILKVTGIPPTEARALASRGEDYRRYQRTTSAFVPWFPKEEQAGRRDTGENP